jgi:bla regulator protein blaR1
MNLESLKNLESWTLAYLLNSLWQLPLLFFAGWVIVRLVSRTGPKAEHRVWVGVLLLQSLLPACSILPWDWLQKMLNWFGDGSPSASARVSVVMGAGTGLGGFHLPLAVLTTIAVAYGTACAYFLARFLWRCMRLVVLRREAVTVSLTGEAADTWLHCANRFQIEDVYLATSSQIFGPVTLGFFRRLLLLPANMLTDLPANDLHTVIAHEFAHLRRNDFMKNLVYEWLSLPISYHPLLWRTRERITETREMVCDEMVAAISGRDEYAHSLLRLASLLLEGMPIRTPHAIGIFDANTLERRLMRLTEKKKETRAVVRFGIVVACVVLSAGICASAVALAANIDGMVASTNDSPKAKGPYTVPANEMQKYVLTKVPPVYPVDAKRAGIQGKVVLNAIIGKDGSVENLTAVSGPNELQQSALDAVRQWTYKPFLVNGDPVEVKTSINVIYTLKK